MADKPKKKSDKNEALSVETLANQASEGAKGAFDIEAGLQEVRERHAQANEKKGKTSKKPNGK